jgi:excisionase family DNA binding protein
MSERLVTARELADLLALKPGTVLDMWERGDLPGHKIGRAVRFDAAEILELTRRPRRLDTTAAALEDRSDPDEGEGDAS